MRGHLEVTYGSEGPDSASITLGGEAPEAKGGGKRMVAVYLSGPVYVPCNEGQTVRGLLHDGAKLTVDFAKEQ
jgi:hypothetical protein